jgi:hypothetical protein
MTEPSPPERPLLPPPRGEAHAMPRLLIIAVALIALGGGGLFIWDWLSRGQQGTALPRPVAQTNRSSQNGTFTSPVPSASGESSAPSSPPSSDELLARIAGLEARLSQVAPPTAPAQASAADAQIAQLQARVASLETALTVERSRADRAQQMVRDTTERLQKTVRAAGALARLRTNLERGYPFEHEFDDANAALSSDANAVARLQPLRQWAESGIASRPDLRSALDGLGADIVRAALLEGTQTWWQAIVARVKSLVIVRPTPDGDIPQAGTAEGDRPPAIVARAEARLNDDDIAGALNELSALTGAAADVAQGWVATARARISADEIMASLDESLRGSLSGSSVGSVSNPAPEKNAPDDANDVAAPSDAPSAGEP